MSTGDLVRAWATWLIPLAILIVALVISLHMDGGAPPSWLLVTTTIVVSFLLLWALFLSRGWTWRDLGFLPLTRSGWHLIWQVPVGLSLALSVTMVLGIFLFNIEPAESSDAATGQIGTITVLPTLVAYTILGPLFEEILLRRMTMGWLERVLRGRFSPMIAIIASTLLSTAVFAALHVVAPVVLWTFFCGLLFAILTRWHRSLWAGVIAHGVVNTIASASLIALLLG